MRWSVGLRRLRGSVRDDLAHLVQVLASSESQDESSRYRYRDLLRTPLGRVDV